MGAKNTQKPIIVIKHTIAILSKRSGKNFNNDIEKLSMSLIRNGFSVFINLSILFSICISLKKRKIYAAQNNIAIPKKIIQKIVAISVSMMELNNSLNDILGNYIFNSLSNASSLLYKILSYLLQELGSQCQVHRSI